MEVLSHLFYATGIIFIMYEITVASRPERLVGAIEKTKNGEVPNSKGLFLMLFVTQFFYMIWVLTGLMSNQWLLFLCLIVLSLLNRKNDVETKKFDAWTSMVLLIFIIINQYHLGISFI